MRIRGIEGVLKSLDDRQTRIIREVAQTMKREGHFVETRAKQGAPSKTGTLRALIFTTAPVVTPDAVTVTVQGGTSYTPYQEFGTNARGAASGYLPASAYSSKPGGITAKKFFLKARKERAPYLIGALRKALTTK